MKDLHSFGQLTDPYFSSTAFASLSYFNLASYSLRELHISGSWGGWAGAVKLSSAVRDGAGWFVHSSVVGQCECY